MSDISLSQKLELLSNSLESMNQKVLKDEPKTAIATKVNDQLDRVSKFIHSLAKTVADYETNFEEKEENKAVASQMEALEALVTLANELDYNSDPEIRKKASVLDEILLTICAPKHAVAEVTSKNEEEIARLRDKYRSQRQEELYKERRKQIDDMNRKADVQKAVKEQVKEYRPMEAPLQTRYCPDHPGVNLMRIADRVYQCTLDNKLYNYEHGYTTQKGNKIPGGSVERQIPDWGHYDPGHTVFDTRNSLMGRFASADKTEKNK